MPEAGEFMLVCSHQYSQLSTRPPTEGRYDIGLILCSALNAVPLSAYNIQSQAGDPDQFIGSAAAARRNAAECSADDGELSARRRARCLWAARRHQSPDGSQRPRGQYVEFDELTFMLNSGSGRAGALDFQTCRGHLEWQAGGDA